MIQAGHSLLTWSLIAFAAVLTSSAPAPTATTDLLRKLDLSEYPRGTTPPDFSAPTTSGQTMSLASLKGRVVLLNFWATWCYECRPEMPVLEKLHREFASQGLTILGVNVREENVAIHKYAKELGLTFPLLTDLKGKTTTSYGVIGLPTTFLVGRDGRAVGLAVGPREWGSLQARQIIETLLAEPTTEKKKR